MEKAVAVVRSVVPLGLLVASLAFPAPSEAQQDGRTEVAADSVPLAAYPGAEPRPRTARALRSYYVGLAGVKDLTEIVVLVTGAPFDEVARFYGERMKGNKWNWNREEYALRHQAQTLRFYRTGVVSGSASGSRAAGAAGFSADLAPILGDPDLPNDVFAARLDSLVRAHVEAEIQVGEGSRRMGSSADAARVRVMIEHPFIDPESMRLVDSTRIQLLRFGEVP